MEEKSTSRRPVVIIFIGSILILSFLAGAYYVIVNSKYAPSMAKLPVVGKYFHANKKKINTPVDKAAQLLAQEGNLKIQQRELEKQATALAQQKALLDQKEAELKKNQPTGAGTQQSNTNQASQTDKTQAPQSQGQNTTAVNPAKRLARMYTEMEAKKAATILGNMDDNSVISILNQMKPDQAGEIISYMNPKKAANVTKKMMKSPIQ